MIGVQFVIHRPPIWALYGYMCCAAENEPLNKLRNKKKQQIFKGIRVILSM
jgi:hypothetical protein